MATITKERNGYYLARWIAADGSRQSVMTSREDFEGAIAEANELEATARFWECVNERIFHFMAQLGFSPDYVHKNFSHAAHIPLPKFRAMLRETSVEFGKPSQWRDGKNPRCKKYRFRRQNMTIDEALMVTGLDITPSAVRSRLKTGWSFEDAVTKPIRTKTTK